MNLRFAETLSNYFYLHKHSIRFPDDPESEFECQAEMVLRRIGLKELIPYVRNNQMPALSLSPNICNGELFISSRPNQGPTVDAENENCKCDTFLVKEMSPDGNGKINEDQNVESSKDRFDEGPNSNVVYDNLIRKSNVGSKSEQEVNPDVLGDRRISDLPLTKHNACIFVTEELSEEDLDFEFPSDIFTTHNQRNRSSVNSVSALKQTVNKKSDERPHAAEPPKKLSRS